MIAEKLRIDFALPAIPVALAALVHWPILGRFFRGDDFLHMYHFVNWGYWPSVLTPFGGHIIFSSKSIFYGLYQAFGVSPLPYFLLALATHLLAVGLLFFTLRDLTGRTTLALFGAALWGMSSVNQGSLGWFSVYGHVLTAPCIAWVVRDLVCVSRSGDHPTRLAVLRWTLLMGIAGSSFGVGLGVALAFPAVAWLMLPAELPERLAITRSFALVSVLLVAWYVAEHVYFFSYERDVSFEATFAHQVSTLRAVPGFLLDLVSYSAASLMFGALVASAKDAVASGIFRETAWVDVLRFSHFVAASVGVLVVLAMVRGDSGRRRELAALLLLVASAYALVALGRANSFATAHTPRYHYLGPLCVTLLLCRTFACFRWSTLAEIRWVGPVLALAWLACTFGFYAEAGRKTAVWAGPDDGSRYAAAVAKIEGRAEEIAHESTLYLPNTRFQPGKIGQPWKFPGSGALFSITYRDRLWHGKPIHFIERNPRVVAYVNEQLPGSLVAELLVTPEEATHAKGSDPPAGFQRLDLQKHMARKARLRRSQQSAAKKRRRAQ